MLDILQNFDEEVEGEANAVDASGVVISLGVVLSVSSSSSSTQSPISSFSDSNSLRGGEVEGLAKAEVPSFQEASDFSQHVDSENTKFVEELFKEEVREGEELRLYGGGVREELLGKEGVEEEEKLNLWLVGVGKRVVGRRKSPGNVPHKSNKIFLTYKILINHNFKILVRWKNSNFSREEGGDEGGDERGEERGEEEGERGGEEEGEGEGEEGREEEREERGTVKERIDWWLIRGVLRELLLLGK